MDLKICLCTVPDETTGRKLATHWLEHRWAACINRIPRVTSHYIWEGKTTESREELLMVKTTSEGAQLIKDSLDDMHPYDCPEWIEMPADTALSSYANWVTAAVTPESS